MHPITVWTPYATAVFRQRFGYRVTDDDAQELRRIVWDALGDWDETRGPWRQFLAARVIHRTIDRLRSRDGRGQKRWLTNHPLELVVDVADPAADFTDGVVFAEVLASLSDRQRQALVDTYVNGRTLLEVAEEWGLSESRVAQIRDQGATRLAGLLRR